MKVFNATGASTNGKPFQKIDKIDEKEVQKPTQSKTRTSAKVPIAKY